MKITIEIERDIESKEDVLAFLTALSGVGTVSSQTVSPSVKTPVNKPEEVKSVPKTEPKPKAEIKPKTEAKEEIKLEDLQAILADILANAPELRAEASAVLKDHGARRLSELATDHYAAVKEQLTALRGQ